MENIFDKIDKQIEAINNIADKLLRQIKIIN